jgi:5-(carboxyamino)imidazole ribonucleotide mutase
LEGTLNETLVLQVFSERSISIFHELVIFFTDGRGNKYFFTFSAFRLETCWIDPISARLPSWRASEISTKEICFKFLPSKDMRHYFGRLFSLIVVIFSLLFASEIGALGSVSTKYSGKRGRILSGRFAFFAPFLANFVHPRRPSGPLKRKAVAVMVSLNRPFEEKRSERRELPEMAAIASAVHRKSNTRCPMSNSREEQDALVGIVMGSDSDWPKIKSAAAALDEFGIAYEISVMSAHRTPNIVQDYASTAIDRGLKVLIAAAGGAAHLAGVVAAHTTLPVIGIPVPTQLSGGLDSLLSTVQMPGDVPVATVGAGMGGPRNAGLLAVQILALSDAELREKLDAFKVALVGKVQGKNENLQKQMIEERKS